MKQPGYLSTIIFTGCLPQRSTREIANREMEEVNSSSDRVETNPQKAIFF
jgi:hypothetical protein